MLFSLTATIGGGSLLFASAQSIFIVAQNYRYIYFPGIFPRCTSYYQQVLTYGKIGFDFLDQPHKDVVL